MKLMTHVVIGYPSLEDTVKIVKTMSKSGVDMIELQIPFSDPLADGPTIMDACEKSLENGTRVKDAFIIMKQLSDQISIPLLFMSYFNIVFKYGVEKFCRDTKLAGAYGLIVPDMPIDEENEEHFYFYCKKFGLKNIQVISPASTDKRLKKNAKVESGFVYFTAHQGITGAKNQLDPNLILNLKRVKKFFSVPVAVGFGISKRKHIEAIAPYSDIAVVGSAIIDVINKSSKKNMEKNIEKFIRGLVIPAKVIDSEDTFAQTRRAGIQTKITL